MTSCSDSSNNNPASISYQQFFEASETSIDVKALEREGEEPLYYVDEGSRQGKPVLLVTGSGTSVTAALLTSHLNTLRDQLGIRLISVQRGGFGPSEYEEGWGYQDYVNDVETVLNVLEIDDFHIFAISGGGPYTSFLAEAMSDRILSLHLAATITGNNILADGSTTLSGTIGTLCAIAGDETPIENIKGLLGTYALSSSDVWWGFSEDNPMLAVEGFEEAAAVDWDYTFFSGDAEQVLSAAAAELWRYCTISLPNLANVTAPVYIYHGLEDSSATESNIDVWLNSLENVGSSTVRLYPNEGHWVQYSHLDQIYVDISQPGNFVVCNRDDQTEILGESKGQELVDSDEAATGMCQAALE